MQHGTDIPTDHAAVFLKSVWSQVHCAALSLSQQFVHFHEGTDWPEPLCLLLEWIAGRLGKGQNPELSHPSVSPHFRHAESTISAMMAVISFEFVVLVMHFVTTQDTVFPPLPHVEF